MKNQIKFEAHDEVPLGIDLLVDFGRFWDAREEKLTKVRPKSIPQNIENLGRILGVLS